MVLGSRWILGSGVGVTSYVNFRPHCLYTFSSAIKTLPQVHRILKHADGWEMQVFIINPKHSFISPNTDSSIILVPSLKRDKKKKKY